FRMRLLPVFLLLLHFSWSLNILMYVHVVGKSHLNFAEKIISLLKQHGHSVDAIFGMFNSYVSLSGTYGANKIVTVHFKEESPWNKEAHLTNPFEELSDWDRVKPKGNGFVSTSALLCDLLLDSSEVADLLSNNKYDLGLINGYEFCSLGLAHHYNIAPVVSYAPTPFFNTQYYYAGLPELPLYENIYFDESHADRSSFFSRVYETLRVIKERYLHIESYTGINRKFRARFGDDFPDVREIAMRTSIDFSNSHPLLEEPRPISLRMRYIGGVARPTPKPLNKEMNKMLDLAPKGNVIFSLGTQIPPELFGADRIRVFVNTFKRFPDFNFLWKFDGKTAMNASNIFNLNWLPQTDLLQDSRVVAFISHMGLNSFTETSFAGVPVVSIPLFADQVHNARRAKALGTGEIVRKSQITEENLQAALEKVLFDEKYRNRAREISAMIAAQPDTPERIFIEGIEFAAKFKNLSSHYRLAGAHHNFLVQVGWDVAAFLTLVLLLSAYITSKIVVFVMSRVKVNIVMKRKLE
ncbi:hypothetical protein PMAYCL1PPCAC_27738, partial [Pristionchus mayeri]